MSRVVTPRTRAFEQWVAESLGPIARSHGLVGRGPTFRKRVGADYVLFVVERRRLDPREAAMLAPGAPTQFRMNVGFVLSAIRPSWLPSRAGPPGLHDFTIYSPDRSLDPRDGSDWHEFYEYDSAGKSRLAELVRDGLGRALAPLGSASAAEILERRLSFAGPLENLSPGAAERLLAIADAAGNADVRRQIVEALARDPIEDANPDRFGWVPRYGNIDPPDQPRRRTRRRLDLLLQDLASDKVYARRVAASALGGWKGEPAAIDALRAALRHDDPWTRGFAARSLGHLGDLAPTTWDQVLTLARQPDVAAAEVGAAIVLLAELDPATRRTEADSVLARMAANSPASTRELRAYRDRVAAMT